jgi:hypothetical protein
MEIPHMTYRTAILLTTWLAACGCAIAAPGNTFAPHVFAAGTISAAYGDACPAFTPDGQTLFFWRSKKDVSSIMESHKVGGAWSTPVTASFSGQWRDLDSTMAPDGSFLLFVSNRPVTPGGHRLDGKAKDGKVYPGFGMNIWRVDRRGTGWGTPVHLPASINTSTATFAPSVAGDGSIYYMARDPVDNDFNLFHSAYVSGKYQTPTRVALGDAGTVIRDPAIAPDQSFIVFSTKRVGSKGPLRLAIAFRSHDARPLEAWSTPIDLGDTVNGESYAMGAQLGPDHRTLYFYSNRPDVGALPGSSWNDGEDNIWFVSLYAWLDAHRR